MLLSLLSGKAKWYPILFDSPMNAARSVSIWLTAALVLAFVLCALLLKGEKRAKFLKISLIFAIAYACIIGIMFLTFTFIEDEIRTILFVPLLVLIVAVAGSAVAIVFKRNKIVYTVAGCIVGAAFITTLVCMGVHFASGDAALDNWITDEEGNPANDKVNSLALYICAPLFAVLIVIAAFFFGRKDKKGFDTKAISYAAVCIALSFALSWLRIVKMPQGGSVTAASLLPLMIYSYMFGTKKGVFAGAIYGLLQALQDCYILHPAQFLLDYPIAFACIGLSGMFANVKKLDKLPQVQFALGALVAGFCRFISHFLSGVFAFGVAFGGDQPAWLYSLVYQATYIPLDIAIVIAAGVLVFSSRAFVKEARKFRPKEEAHPQESEAN